MGETPEQIEPPEFAGIAKHKLDVLLKQGWEIKGYAIGKRKADQSWQYGFVTTGAFVGWWLPEYYPNHTSGDTPPNPEPEDMK